MENPILAQISVDLLLILRVILAFGWGCAWASYLQFTDQGQFLARDRTWITVVVGVGVDLLIAYAGDWWTVALVISVSSIGVIVRSLWNELHTDRTNYNSHKVKVGIENATTVTGEIITKLETVLRASKLPGEEVARVSEILGRAHRLREILLAARRGEEAK